ncbi:MAG: NADH-quinone oxidoreductase subunit NuoG [Gammaproteobacteria bacterium]
MTDEGIEIEVNGEPVTAKPGQMLIEVTDAAGVYVPRFCYHEKLSIAANCRMCLVEVENVPKPLPACATPVTPGMKVRTKSARAISAQKATMEFLLINHPLDCPICDQGGECELQDLAMGFGRGVSRYNEGKRSVADKDIGPLVSTDMTRCIHCTRCVRFGEEIAGIQELGTIGRGENMEIGTYVERSVDHELAGNIIDLCPVGALNNKPYRFSARAWQMTQRDMISPHDCVGANLYAHVLGGEIRRVVPKANEALNETWATDRDRFSYQGIYADDRVTEPMLRRDGELQACSWEEALEAAVLALQSAGSDSAALVSPSATVEEGYLLARIMRLLGSGSIDHRLRRRDFRLQDEDPLFPGLGMPIAELAGLDAILIVGSNLRREAPLLAHRIRQAAQKGARVYFVNPARFEYLFPLAGYRESADLPDELAAAAADQALLDLLSQGERSAILLGQIAMRHPDFAGLRQQAGKLAEQTGSTLGYIPEGANAVGLSLAGVLPHRGLAGAPAEPPGKHLAELFEQPPAALVLLGAEPEHDCASPAAADGAFRGAGQRIVLNAFLSDSVRAGADIVLPVSTFAETDGTFVNAAGDWQSFSAATAAPGESRPAWKVLRVLGNLLGLPDCDYDTAAELAAEVAEAAAELEPDNQSFDLPLPERTAAAEGDPNLDVPMYQIDALLRRASALQLTQESLGGAQDADTSDGEAA